jgi:endonuclease-3
MLRLNRSLYEELDRRYAKLWPWPDSGEYKQPFKNLIITILSQNTTGENCGRAYKNLSERFKIEPAVLAKAEESEIREAIRPGGLQSIKTGRIKQVSKAVLDRFGGDLGRVLALPKAEARKAVMELPGIGNKTADVFLTIRYGHREVIPIDTHMDRISKRLGLVKENASYEEVQKALLSFIPKEFREKAAGLIWLLAKHTCKAQKPKCEECLFKMECKEALTKRRKTKKISKPS